MSDITIKKCWFKYYKYLEKLRKSGITNMFEAHTHLEEEFNLYMDDAKKILISWMKNYEEIKKVLDKEERSKSNGKR